MADDFKKLQQLIASGNSCITIVTQEEAYTLDIIRQFADSRQGDMWLWSASEGVHDGLALLDDPPIAQTDKPAAGLANLASSKAGSICVTLDLAEYLRDAKVMRVLRETIQKFEDTKNVLIMIDSSNKLPDIIRSCSVPLDISLPDTEELREILIDTLRQFRKREKLEVAVTKEGLEPFLRNLRGLTRRQASRLILDTVVDDHVFSDADINKLIAGKRRLLHRGGLLDYVEAPLDLDEIGGLCHLKKWLSDRKKSFSADAEKFGLSAPRGVLMLGVQGCGKSLCAKAVATAWKQPLLRLDPSSLYASYVGESEKNLLQALKQTEAMSPVILWIDEIEKGFASAASQSTDGGLSKRMFGTLLTWMQEHEQPVFVIATANDIEALPPELLRKGRFDEIFFVSLPKKDVRKIIFKIHLVKRKRDPSKFDFDALADAAEGFSGAEIEQAVISGLHESYARDDELNTESILNILKHSPPLSVTMREKVQMLMSWSKDRCVPAD
jgi:hypothetical protein